MTRMSHRGSFLLVEGSDDMRFWRTRRDQRCELVCGESKGNVMDGIEQLDAQGFEGAIGVVDSDYDVLVNRTYASENVVATDAHDLECLLFRSQGLEAVLAEFGDAAKIRRFETAAGSDVRNSLLERGLAFGRLRWAALRHHDTVGLGEVSIPHFVDEDTWEVNEKGLWRAVPTCSQDDVGTWSLRIAQLPPADPWHVARGHDLLDILRIGLRKVLGDVSPQVGRRQIAQVLRQALPDRAFKGTGLYGNVRRWETQNAPYVVLGA